MKKTDMKRIVLLLTTALWFAAGSVFGQNTPDAYNQKGSEALGKKKYAEAFNWFRKSAEAGDAYGQYQLAYCYRNGEGVDASEEEAIRWFRASANGGCQYAYNPLGRMLEKGSPDEAFIWYKKSADAGDKVGQYNLAMCYINGTGTDYNDAEAKRLFEKSAAQDYAPAKDKLTWINNKDYWKKTPIIDFFGLSNEVTTSEVKFDVKIKAENGRVKNTAVYLNGNKHRGIIAVKEDGYDYSWSQVFNNLREGQNTIRVEATNRAGMGSKEFIVTYRSSQKATVTWSSFESTTYDQQFHLKATINSESKIQAVTLTFNNQSMNIDVPPNQYRHQINIPLTLNEGQNFMTISVKNDAGETITKQELVNYIKLEKRLALVIGNSEYEHNFLPNPVNDATDIAQKLESLGFEVIKGIDTNHDAMNAKVVEFGKKAPNYDVVLFYYAGHGIQEKGENYLLPIKEDINFIADLEKKCISANYVLNIMDESRCPKKIMILDACRNNPLKRSLHRSFSDSGLAEMKATDGTFICFSVGAGEEAIDNSDNGRNSPYTAALLQMLDVPNLEINALFRKVGKEVKSKTGQTPWMSHALYDDFYINKK